MNRLDLGIDNRYQSRFYKYVNFIVYSPLLDTAFFYSAINLVIKGNIEGL